MKKQLTGVMLIICTYIQAQTGIGTPSPNSTLDVRGSLSTRYTSFTGNTTIVDTDNILVFTGSAAVTATLPSAIGCNGRKYVVKNASTTLPTPAVIIMTTLSQTIDGTVSWILDEANETAALISNGANWFVVSQNLPGLSGINCRKSD